MTPVAVQPGDGPVILGQPHCGLFLPDEIATQLNDRGRTLVDTDWHIDRLYDGLLPDATVVCANFHRYVIDPNRDPSGASLYPGQSTTELVPTTTFDNEPIWQTIPTSSEIEARRIQFHQAYHDALAGEIARVRGRHGVVVLYDCHSIRSHIPHLFDGQLPDLNIGDNGGETCSAVLTNAIVNVCETAREFSHVVNGRFRGGWTTRRYGDPASNVHAIQMEIAQNTYLASEAPPFEYDEQKAAVLRSVLKKILHTAEKMALENKLTGD